MRLLSRPFDRALGACSDFGVGVDLRGGFASNDRQSAPVHVGCGIELDGTIVWDGTKKDYRDFYSACALLHELTHVVVWRRTGSEIAYQLEALTIAFEYQLARDYHLMREWHTRWMRNWGIPLRYFPEPTVLNTWSNAGQAIRNKVLKRSKEWCVRKGLLDEQGTVRR